MTKWRHVVALVVLACTVVVYPAHAQLQPADTFILRAPTASVADIVALHGLTVVGLLRDTGVDQILLVKGRAGTPADVLVQEVEAEHAVVGFEPDRRATLPETTARAQLGQSTAAILESLAGRTVVDYFGTAASSTYVTQPAAGIIRIHQAQQLATGGGIVAVIDTGVDPLQPLLKPVLVPGFDFTRNQPGTASELADLAPTTAAILNQSTAAILEQNFVVTLNQSTAAILEQSTATILQGGGLPPAFGHGTMVAGLVHLVAPTARVMPLKAFRADGTSNVSDILRAIYYAVDYGAHVINMSFGLPESSEELMRAIAYATSRGVVPVAAVGNDGREVVQYPSGYRNAIAVASTDNLDQRSVFTNFGDAVVSVAAPGEALITTYPGGRYAGVWGTSFSTALAAGAVALMTQVYPPLNASQAASDLARGVRISSLGEGRIDVYAAVLRSATRK